jgi:hypothetical protein
VKKFQILFSLFFLFSFSLVYSQASGDSLSIQYYYDQNSEATKQLDTSLSNLCLYRPNSSFQNFSYNLGNIGLAFVPLTFNYNRPSENIFRAFSGYMITSDSVRYYKTQKPYTEFNYTQGLTKEHFPGGIHTQQLNKNLGLSLMYQVISSEGTYQQQQTKGVSFYGAMDFTSNNKKYLSYFNFVYNKLFVTENGGLTMDSDTTFRQGGGQSNRQLLATNLKSTTNTMYHKGISWKNYWFFTGPPDSAATAKTIYAGLFNETNITSSYVLFKSSKEDIDSNLFKSVYSDTITKDSMNLSRIDNFFGVVLGRKKENILPFMKIGWRQQWNNIQVMNSSFGEFELNKEIKDKFFLRAFAQYGLNGRRSGDLKLLSSIHKVFNSGDVIYFQTSFSNQRSSYFDDFSGSSSNLHIWNNSFNRNMSYAVSGNYSLLKWNLFLEAGYQGIQGYVYFDEKASLMQNNSLLHSYYASIFKVFQYKWFRTRSYVRYQNSSSNLIRMPDLLARQEIAFLINHKAIHAEIGFLITYFSSYATYAYDPSLRDYYLQTSFKAGNYPFLDFYAALKVGPTRIFFKADHFNSGLTGNNYEMLPYYPMTDLTFKLGIKWGFWN